VTYVADKKNVTDALAAVVEPGDLVIALGAGDINASARELVARFEAEGAKS
jgi:UDP-N-acetylmuramate--alanine ligase